MQVAERQALVEAIQRGDRVAVREQLRGQDFGGREDGGVLHYDSEASKFYDTAATLAVKSGDADMVRLVINANLNLDETSYPDDETPLDLALASGDEMIVALLFAAGARKTQHPDMLERWRLAHDARSQQAHVPQP